MNYITTYCFNYNDMKKEPKTYKARLDFNKHTGKVMILDAGCSYSGMAAAQKTNMEKIIPGSSSIDFASGLNETSVPADLIPDAKNVMNAPFRLLSATIVGGGSYKATDFTNEEVLRASTQMLLRQTVYTDHWSYSVENWLGIVSAVAWTESFMQDGKRIPAGIDGIISINTANERGQNIARGILMGAVHSNSVSVEFDWVPSHDFKTEGNYNDGMHKFYEMLGMEVEGEMVRRIVTKITAYHESSLVSMGADPYAKKIDINGEITNIDTANIVSLSKATAAQIMNFESKGLLRDFETPTDADYRRDIVNFTNNKFKNPQTEAMQMSKFTGVVNAAIDSVIAQKHYENRTKVLDAMAAECGVGLRQIQNYLNGTTTCPAQETLVSMAKVLLLAQTDLIKACEEDGCKYTAPTPTGVGETVIEVPFNKDKVEAEKTEAEKAENCGDEEEDEEDMAKKEKDADMAKVTEELQKALADLETYKAKYAAAGDALVNYQLESRKEIDKLQNQYKEVMQEAELLKSEKTQAGLQLAQMSEKETALLALQEQFNAAQTELTTLRADSKFSAFGREKFEDLRRVTLDYYKKQSGKNAQAYIIELIEKSEDMEFLKGTVAQYGAQLADEFNYTCKKCGSHEHTFGSVVGSKLPPTEVVASDIKTEGDVQKAFNYKTVFNDPNPNKK